MDLEVEASSFKRKLVCGLCGSHQHIAEKATPCFRVESGCPGWVGPWSRGYFLSVEGLWQESLTNLRDSSMFFASKIKG